MGDDANFFIGIGTSEEIKLKQKNAFRKERTAIAAAAAAATDHNTSQTDSYFDAKCIRICLVVLLFPHDAIECIRQQRRP